MSIWTHISRTYRGKKYGAPLFYFKKIFYQVDLEKFERLDFWPYSRALLRICIKYFTASSSVLYTERRMIWILYLFWSTYVLYTKRQRICIMYFIVSTSVLTAERRRICILCFTAVNFCPLHGEKDYMYIVIYYIHFCTLHGGAENLYNVLYLVNQRICILLSTQNWCTLHHTSVQCSILVYTTIH